MGRRRIVIEEIKDSNKRYVTFTKRRQGLFKKVDTACRMYGSQIGVIVFSPTGKLYSSGPVDSVINQFLLHQSSSSSSSSSYLNLEEHTLISTTGDHIEDGNKMRSRSRGDDVDDDRAPMIMPEQRETKKRKLLMKSSTTTTEAAAAAAAAATYEEEEENGEFLLIKNSETEQEGLMMINELMGIEQNVTTELEEEVLLGECNMGSSSSTVVTTTTSDQLVASSSSSCFLESEDHELDEVLNGFADYIIADHPYELETTTTTTMFDLLPHQGVYDDDDDEGCFTFCDTIWPTIDDVVQDQVLMNST